MGFPAWLEAYSASNDNPIHRGRVDTTVMNKAKIFICVLISQIYYLADQLCLIIVIRFGWTILKWILER
jgi:hypothetical protein